MFSSLSIPKDILLDIYLNIRISPNNSHIKPQPKSWNKSLYLRKASTFFFIRLHGRKIVISLEFVSLFNKTHTHIILQVS